MKNDAKQDKPNDLKHRKIRMAISVGLGAGVIWGIVGFLAYYLQFTNVGTSIYAKPLLNPDYVQTWQGHLVGLLFFVLYTLIAAFIYVFTLTRFKGPIAGIVYGIFLWALLFFGLNSLFHLTKPIMKLGWTTNSVMFSLYVLIGLFIGYSLSAEFNNEDQGNQ